MTKPIMATWSLSLNCRCPKCNEYLDLLDDPDFWDGGRIQACEYDTPATQNYDVECPECGEEFKVDFQY